MGFDAFTPLTNEGFAYLGGGTTRANEWNMLFKTSLFPFLPKELKMTKQKMGKKFVVNFML